MRLKCFTCGAEFDDIQQLASHKRRHGSESQEKKPGVICLGCGRPIPIAPDKANYSGPLQCPSCKGTMKVTLEGGEVVVARFG
jgi:DNA-directed RNA polymerase subunit RPC12/RpoP